MFRVAFSAVAFAALLAAPSYAGVPRDLQLAADEQAADETTGVTIARGNAELSVRSHRIHGTADVIEVRPKLNEILFKGRANVSVDGTLYVSDTVSCSLDFIRCSTVSDDQDLPPLPSATAAVSTPQ